MAAMKANKKTSEDFTDEERKALNAQIEKSMRSWPSEDDRNPEKFHVSFDHGGNSRWAGTIAVELFCIAALLVKIAFML